VLFALPDGGLLTLILKTTLGWIPKLFGYVREKLAHESPRLPVPGKTLLILLKPGELSLWWGIGTVAGKPAMLLGGRLTVTNISKYDIYVNAVKLKNPATSGQVLVKDGRSDRYGSYGISSGETTDVQFDLQIVPPVRERGQAYLADIALEDQFGNHHWIRKVEFPHR
jgi:hypothetical protein